MASIEEKVENLIKPIVEQIGYELYDVEYVKEGKDFFLRIYIDSQNGINLEDCEKVNNAISDVLDKADYIKEQYFLEVSSPGIERILRKDKHLEKYLNNEVQLNLFQALNKEKKIEGILIEFNNEDITIKQNDNIIKIPRKNISLIKTVYNWD